MKNARKFLINVGHAEGVSYLILLFIAMPLKYLMAMPQPVRIVGSLHGVLFVTFVIAIIYGLKKIPLSLGAAIKVFVLSLIPFGSFYISKMLPPNNNR